MDDERVKEIQARIAELEGRWPKHSVPPALWAELEELDGQLAAALQRTDKNEDAQDG